MYVNLPVNITEKHDREGVLLFIKRVHRMSLFVLKSVRYKFGKKEHGYNTCPAILMMETGGHTISTIYVRASLSLD